MLLGEGASADKHAVSSDKGTNNLDDNFGGSVGYEDDSFSFEDDSFSYEGGRMYR